MSKDPTKSDLDTQAGRERADTAPAAEKNAGGDSPLIAKLKKQKAEKSGFDATVLPETGIIVTWPQFKSHGVWMKATRLAKGNPQGVMNTYLPLLCKFDGEKLTIAEFKELVPTDDVLFLLGEVMGDKLPGEDGEDGDDGDASSGGSEGNASH